MADRVCEQLVGRLFAHWVLLANVATTLTLLGTVAAPALRAIGLDAPAELIYASYLPLCPQRPSHSYFLFGFQLALEQREIAMFSAQLAGGLAYGLVRHRVPRLDWPILVVSSPPIRLGRPQPDGRATRVRLAHPDLDGGAVQSRIRLLAVSDPGARAPGPARFDAS